MDGTNNDHNKYSLRRSDLPDSDFFRQVVDTLRFEPKPDEDVPAGGDDEGGGDEGDDDPVGEDEA